MAIYASTSTITTQTVPLIVIDPATISDNYLLRWDATVGAFTAQEIQFPDYFTINLSADNIQGILPAANGGTGIETYSPGDILYANENGILENLSIGIGDNQQVLTSLNGLPIWQNTTELKNVVISKINTFEVVGGNIGNILPDNSQLKNISISIDSPYDATSISISDSSETLVTSSEILYDKTGLYIYSMDKFYSTGDQLTLNISGGTTGNMRIFVEYVVL